MNISKVRLGMFFYPGLFRRIAGILILTLLFWGTAATVRAAQQPYLPTSERISLPQGVMGETSDLQLFADENDGVIIFNYSTGEMVQYDTAGDLVSRIHLDFPGENKNQSAFLWMSNHRIYIKPSESNNIWTFDLKGRPLKKLTLKNPRLVYKFKDMAVDPQGYIFLLEGMSGTVPVFNAAGEYCGSFARCGQEYDDLRGIPQSIFIDGRGKVYFASQINTNESQIVKYSKNGERVITFTDEVPHGYSSIYVDRWNNVYAVSPLDSTLTQFDREGRMICQTRIPCANGLAVTGRGQVFIDSGINGNIHQLYPGDSIQLIIRGNKALASHDWNLAEKNFKKAMILDNQVKYVHSALGEVYFRQQKWLQSLAEFKFARDNQRYSNTMKSLRSYLFKNARPYLLAGFIGLLFLCFLVGRFFRKTGTIRSVPLISVIWNPSTVFRYGLGRIRPIQTVVLLVIFVTTHYLSRFLVNPIFLGERQVFSTGIFIRDAFIIVALLIIWMLVAYKVGELFQGLATAASIRIATPLCLVPLIIGEPLLALFSHCLTYDELWLFQLLNGLMLIWTAALFLMKLKWTEDYSWRKACGVGLVNIMTMGLFLIFIGFVVGVNQQLWSFITDFYQEICNRMI